MKKVVAVVLVSLLAYALYVVSYQVPSRIISDTKVKSSASVAEIGVTLSPVGVTPKIIEVTPIRTAVVIAIQSLNVRESAGEDKPVIGVTFYNSRVSVIGECDTNGWVKIETDSGLIGWVNADYLSSGVCE